MWKPATVTVLVLLAASLGSSAEAAPRMCAGKRTTIVGTSGNDVIRGTRGHDVIDGLAGSDVINGLQGNDTICGGYGADDLRGNAGRDRLYGGLDALTFQEPQSTIRTGDTLRGGPGDDVLVPGIDNRDGFIPPEGPVGDVDDKITYDTAPRRVSVNLVTQRATGDGTDRVVVNGRAIVIGTRFADTLVGSNHDIEFRGMAGNDRISDGAGDDRLDGGPGTDNNLSSGGGADVCLSIEVGTERC